MKINTAVVAALFTLAAASSLEARHHRHREDGGLHLAAEIVGLVKNVVAPRPKVVVAAPPPPVVVTPPPKVVVAPPPPPPAPAVVHVHSRPQDYDYVWYRGMWVPRHRDWYWYNNGWVWVGRGYRPAPPPWRPDFRRPIPVAPPRHHHRPAPPPRHHHRPAPPPPRHHHRPAHGRPYYR